MPKLYDLHATEFNPENPTLDYAATQALTAVGNTITPVGGFLQLTSNAAYVLNSTPMIATANAKAGDVLTLLNSNAADAITLTAGANAALKLGAATRALGPDGSITLIFDGTDWVELNFLATATH